MNALNDSAKPPQRTTVLRVLAGLCQGLALYGLYNAGQAQSWLATNEWLFAPLVLIAVFLPIIFVVSLGSLPRKTLLFWLLTVALVLAGLAVYDQWRNIGALTLNSYGGSPNPSNLVKYPSVLLYVFSAIICFISQSLVAAASIDGKRIATYNSYFDYAWKLLVQVKFSLTFVGAFWAVLYLGGQLFQLLGINLLHDLLEKSWFVIPVCMTALSFALHLTDVRPAIVSSIRNLLLMLWSWILPIATLLVGAFLVSMLFTGLDVLWATKRATFILLLAVAMLVVLVNAAFQNGDPGHAVPAVIRYAGKTACLLLIPLALLATYALSLRVNEYGWTTDRIIASCCTLVALCYAFGYSWAALRGPTWLLHITRVNIACAFLIVAVVLGLFSPLLDPARVSVNSQINRFNSGAISVDKFDFAYLKFEGKRFGAQALSRLSFDKDHPQANEIGKRIELVMAQKYKMEKNPELPPTSLELAANFTAWPKGAVMPDSFLNQSWKGKANSWELPDCLFKGGHPCDVFTVDFDDDGVNELLIVSKRNRSTQANIFRQHTDKTWINLGLLSNNPGLCDEHVNQLKAGTFSLKAPFNKDLEINGQRYVIRDPYSQSKPCD
jgi:Domain of unknown function (DUF4153)